MVALITTDLTTAQAQSGDETTGRIVVRLLDDGRVEFGWQLRMNGEWGARVPGQRFFPTGTRVNRWRNSSLVEVDGATIGRINARRLSDGRIEFAFTPTGGQRILPPARFFPTDATIGRWLHSTEIEVSILQVGPDDNGPPPVVRGITRAAQKDLLVERLFGLRPGEANVLTSHDLNDWGCNLVASPPADCNAGKAFYGARVNKAAWNAYEGGHSGWDASRRNVNRAQFRSLTSGIVIAAGRAWRCADIAVYDPAAHATTIYLHAAQVLVDEGDAVVIGDVLGREGTSCTVAAHVHIEVRPGRAQTLLGGLGYRIYARGAGIGRSDLPAREVSIDPLPYIYWWATGRQGGPPTPLSTWLPTSTSGSPVVSNDLIREGNSSEVYVFKAANGKWFRRHVVAGGVINAVPEWSWDKRKSLSSAYYRLIRESPLVRIPGDAGSVYVVEETGEDDIVLRRIPNNAEAFDRAACDGDGVFAMSIAEYNYWAARAAQRGVPLRGAPVSAAYRCPQ